MCSRYFSFHKNVKTTAMNLIRELKKSSDAFCTEDVPPLLGHREWHRSYLHYHIIVYRRIKFSSKVAPVTSSVHVSSLMFLLFMFWCQLCLHVLFCSFDLFCVFIFGLMLVLLWMLQISHIAELFPSFSYHGILKTAIDGSGRMIQYYIS